MYTNVNQSHSPVHEDFFPGGLSPLISAHTSRIVVIFNYCVLGHAIGAAGTVANIINVIVFMKMGFADTINISLMGLAVADLFGLITVQWLFMCYNPLLQDSRDVPFIPDDVQYITGGWPHIGFSRVTGMITVFITFERCLCVTLPLKVKNLFTPRRTTAVIITIFVLMFGIVVPVFTVVNLGWKFDPYVNRSRIGVIFAPIDVRLPIEDAVFMINNIVAYLTFGLVTLFTSILVIELKSKAKWRAGVTTGDSKEEKSATRERKAVLMVSVISTAFIFCFTPATLVCIGIMTVPEFTIFGAYQNLNHALMSVGFLLEAVNSSINILIYMKMSSKYRSTFYEMVGLKATQA